MSASDRARAFAQVLDRGGRDLDVSALHFLIAWANAPFAIAAGIAAVFALLQVTGILGVLAGGGEGDADHDVDTDVDHDVDADADADADHDADGEKGQAGAGGHGHSFAATALGPLGFGKIPFSFIWQTFAFVFAIVGFALNFRYFDAGNPPLVTLAWTLPAGLVGGYAGVALLARLLGPVLSSKGQEATSRNQLIGQMGVVISTRVDAEFGEVRIRDKDGHDIRVVCKLAPGAKETPLEHQQIVVVDCEDGSGQLYVEALDLEEPALRRGV